MTINKTLLTFLLCTSMLLATGQSNADIGEVTINGEPVPGILFKGYSNHSLSSETRCPPTSDTYVRDIIVRRALIIREAEKRGLDIAESSMDKIAEYTREIEYLGPDGDITARAKAELLKQYYIYSGYIDYFPAMPTHNAVLNEYKRAIKAKDPRFTNVTLVRYTPLSFTSEKDATEAVKQLQAGSSLREVTESFAEDYHSFHYADFWTPIYDVDQYSDDGNALISGTAISLGTHKALYFNEVKHRSRLRPFTNLRNRDNYVYDEIKWDLQRQLQQDRDRALWKAANVREDGESIEMAENYPACQNG